MIPKPEHRLPIPIQSVSHVLEMNETFLKSKQKLDYRITQKKVAAISIFRTSLLMNNYGKEIHLIFFPD